MRKAAAIAISALLVVTFGCKAKEKLEQVAISADLAKRSTTDLLKQTADDHYTAPADGRLSEQQIQMYLKVREHEKEIAQVAKKEMQQHAAEAQKAGDKSLAGMADSFKALGSLSDVLTADLRAAKELGYNTKEYGWVKGQVLAASSAAMGAKIAQSSQAMMDSAYAQTKKQYDEAKDDTSKKMLGEMLAGYDKSRQEMAAQQKEDPATAYNRELLSKHDGALNALTAELSKWEDKPGEVQKGMDDWQKNMDKAVADAKAHNAQH